jgi:hypothetical protein
MKPWELDTQIRARFAGTAPAVLAELSHPAVEVKDSGARHYDDWTAARAPYQATWHSKHLVAPEDEHFFIVGVELTALSDDDLRTNKVTVTFVRGDFYQPESLIAQRIHVVPPRQEYGVRISTCEKFGPGLVLLYGWRLRGERGARP